MSNQYPTAICRNCGKLIFKGDGVPNKKGAWICFECEEKKRVK